MKGAVDSIETLGLVDGPGIRTVIFLSGCKLRCKYCHNPEMLVKGKENMEVDELIQKVKRNKPYFKRNSGGVTFSGGEPLLQIDFLIEACKKLKNENIHIALDTAGVGIGRYDEILPLVDLVLLDIKHTNEEDYKDLTGQPMTEFNKFIDSLNKSGKEVWIRQVIVPDLTDNEKYLISLNEYLKKIKNITRIDFLPYHKLGMEKYKKLNTPYPYLEKQAMDKEACKKLYEHFMKDIYKKEEN